MTRRAVETSHAPAAIGPYSQAIVDDARVYTAGQIALHPETGEMVGAGDIEAETRQALTNLREVLQAAGSKLDLVLRCDVFMTDLAQFEDMNRIYAEFFRTTPPARVTVQAAALPKGALVEIAAIARLLT
jgi:2-iminobutanoate/2-iminopropanoate deaminase